MSLKRIAELTNTSVATVSRVLNNPSYQCQNPETTENIRKIARELNYVPNQNARNLKMGESSSTPKTGKFVIDILLARFDTLDQDPFFSEMFRCIETEFHKQNCLLGDILNIPDVSFEQNPKKLQQEFPIPKKRSVLNTRSDGLLILGKCPSDIIDSLLRRYNGVIAIDRNPTEHKIDEVVCSGSFAASTAVEYLLELGHKKIAYIGDCNMESRYTGYYESLQNHKIPLTYDYVVPTKQTKEDGFRAYEQICSCKIRPTAVFCANDITALGFLQAMKEKNGRRKKDVYRPAIVSIDDIDEATRVSPMLTTVRIPKEDMVHLAVSTLRDRLQNGHRECVRLELPCHLMIRESSGVHIL